MLYERWRQIVKENRDDLALCNAASGQQWTFGQLDAAAGKAATTTDPIVYPSGICAEFIFAVLGAWRAGQAVCPLEGQAPRQFSRLWKPVESGGTVRLSRTTKSSTVSGTTPRETEVQSTVQSGSARYDFRPHRVFADNRGCLALC